MSILENYKIKNYSGDYEGVVGCNPAGLQAALEEFVQTANTIGNQN